jgi:dihydrofolate reductase
VATVRWANPCFVVTHRPPASSGPEFTFVTDRIERALAKAQEVAADERIRLMGADIDQQFLAAGLVDEIDVTPQRVRVRLLLTWIQHR